MNIKIRNITKLFGKQKALDNISFSVHEGELLGLLGPNGAGKSTLMKIITGYLPANEGEIWIGNQKISYNNIEFRSNIGYLPENNPLYTDLYVKELLDITAGFYEVSNKKQRIAEIIELTSLGDEQHKKIGALSKGFRQRVGLAQALIHDPRVLIMDEPTTGLDPNQLGDIRMLIQELSKKKTVIVSSHIMQEVEAICTHAVIINRGKIVADGNISDIKKGTIHSNQIIITGFNKKVMSQQLLAIKGIKNAIFDGEHWQIESNGNQDIRPEIFHFAVENDLIILTLKEEQRNLESIFHQLTNNKI